MWSIYSAIREVYVPLIKRTAIRVRCTGGETIKGAVNELHLAAFGTSGPGVAANYVNYRTK